MNPPLLSNSEPLPAAHAPSRNAPATALSCDDIAVLVEEHIAGVEDLWRRFERNAIGHAFQSFDRVSFWHKTAGQKARVSPRIIVGWGPEGEVLFLLPLGLRRRFGLVRLNWLGGTDAVLPGGLFDADFLSALDAGMWAGLWTRIRALLPQVDVVEAADPPEFRGAAPNPATAMRPGALSVTGDIQ